MRITSKGLKCVLLKQKYRYLGLVRLVIINVWGQFSGDLNMCIVGLGLLCDSYNGHQLSRKRVYSEEYSHLVSFVASIES